LEASTTLDQGGGKRRYSADVNALTAQISIGQKNIEVLTRQIDGLKQKVAAE